MSQRESGYERKERDAYETPPWVTQCLLPHIPPRISSVWEPAAGTGQMAGVLGAKFTVLATDIDTGRDFLAETRTDYPAIISNPPYSIAAKFIGHALRLTRPSSGYVAMLLRCDYHHAKTRPHLFADCTAFARMVVLTKRIRWFEDSKGGPSFNHAWFVWDWTHTGAPTLAYEPRSAP